MRKPFFKKSHSAWYVHQHGRMIRLGSEKEKAFQKYHELMASDAPSSGSDSVASLLNIFLEWCQKNRAENTYIHFRYLLSSFIRFVGTELRIASLKPFHVTTWLDSQDWNVTTHCNAVRSVKRAFNWAVKEGRLSQSPLRHLQRPTPKRREAFVTREQFQLILAQVSDPPFRDYLMFLFETGARPQEIRVIEASHCDLDTQRVVLPVSLSKGKKTPRVIFLTESIVDMIARRCEEFPGGAIFRNTHGTPWTRESVNCRVRWIRKKLKEAGQSIPGFCVTALRHGFATDALKSGVDPVTVAILMGHRDTTQVARTYQHLAADQAFLVASLSKIRGRVAPERANTREEAKIPLGPAR